MWFGTDWGAPICAIPSHQVPTPVGEECFLCEETIVEGDDGEQWSSGEYVHKECAVRNIVGSVFHLSGQCQYVGHCNEASTQTYRQEALDVWRYMLEGGPIG